MIASAAASPAGALLESFFSHRLFSLGFWAIDVILLVAIVGVVIVLATDDRDPSIVLAWLFVVLLLPVLGLVAYFFIGRNFRHGESRRSRSPRSRRPTRTSPGRR